MFQLCQSCQRHIKANRCPFCGSTAVAPVTTRPADSARVSRAHVLSAVAVAGAVAVAACGNDRTEVPIYGAPGENGSSSGGSSGNNWIPPYGAPPDDEPADAGSEAAVNDASDADGADAS